MWKIVDPVNISITILNQQETLILMIKENKYVDTFIPPQLIYRYVQPSFFFIRYLIWINKYQLVTRYWYYNLFTWKHQMYMVMFVLRVRFINIERRRVCTVRIIIIIIISAIRNNKIRTHEIMDMAFLYYIVYAVGLESMMHFKCFLQYA